MTTNSEYHEEMQTYISDTDLKNLFTDNNKTENVKHYIKREITKNSNRPDLENVHNLSIIIPAAANTPEKLQKWIYIYLKMSKHYHIKDNITKTQQEETKYYFSTLNPKSIYEIVGHVYNHKGYHERYLKMTLCRTHHEQRQYGYTFHHLDTGDYSNIAFEMSEML